MLMSRSPLRLTAPAILGMCGLLCVPQPIAAQTVEHFYKGRTLELLTTAPGGRYDLASRLVARHFGEFLPGRPKVVVQVEPGAGGLTVANRLANTSPRDGSVLALAQPASWQVAIAGDPNARFDPAKMTWIGSMSSFAGDADLLIVRASHPVKSVADLGRPDLSAKLGAGTAGSTNLTFAILARDVLGLHVDVVRGYPGAPNLFLAMQSGEIDGQVVALSSLTGTQQALWDQKQVRPLVQFGRVERLASLPDVPTGRELIKDADGLALLEFAELPFFMALPLVAPPGIPNERAAALRQAFALMVVDPAFIDDVRKASVELSPTDGEAIARLVAKSAATPKDVIRRYNSLIAAPR
jgi:tripartite-type tricarboxylate transporter receptor subunit TctC